MWDALYAFGRGLFKFLIALFVGVGIGMVTIGGLALKNPQVWDFGQRPPFGPLLLGIGAGLLTTGGVLFILIFIPWPRRKPSREEPWRQEPTPQGSPHAPA